MGMGDRVVRGGPVSLLAAALLLSGCQMLRPSPPLPSAHQIVSNPLLIYSDFPIAARDPLLTGLTDQQEAIGTILELPAAAQPVHIYLFPTSEEFNAFMARRFPRFPSRRAFFVENDGDFAVYAYWGERVAEDLRHEVAHGYLHATVPNLPLWLDEGLAEYFEVPSANRGLNRPHLQQLVASGEQSEWQPDLKRLESKKTAAELSQHDYAEAWAWVHFLLADTDRQKLLQGYLRTLRSTGTAMPLSDALGYISAEPAAAFTAHLVSVQANGAAQPAVERISRNPSDRQGERGP